MKPLLLFASLWNGVISRFWNVGTVIHQECSDNVCCEDCGVNHWNDGVPFDGVCRWSEEFEVWETHLCDYKNFYVWRV